VTAETAATLVDARAEPRRISFAWLWPTFLLVVLTFLVIYPVAMLLLGESLECCGRAAMSSARVEEDEIDSFHRYRSIVARG